MIPPKEILCNNSSVEASFLGYAHSQLATLREAMAFQGLNEGYRRVSPYLGVEVEVWKSFSIEVIAVNVDENIYGKNPYERKLREEKTVLDNRFFVRIGSPSDIELDDEGHVIRDDTRYYWIDFFATTDNSIAFYSPGSRYGEYEIDDTIYYKEARFVTDETFLQVVNFPDYMFHNYVRSFDLTSVVGNKSVSARFVAGYHFLATGDSIIYTPEIPTVAGGDIDLATGTSKNPPNRFFVDLESRTMCWYHVLQKWKLPDIGPPVHTESTGSVAGVIIGIDYDNGWITSGSSLFSFSGDVADGLISNTGSDAILEPIGILSDISTLNRETVTFYTSYLSGTTRIIAALPGFDISSCVETSLIMSQLANNSGYEQYQSASFSMTSGSGSSDANTTHNYYDYPECANPNCTSATPIKYQESISWSESSSNWSDTTVGMTIDMIDGVGVTDVVNGNGNASLSESVSCNIHSCQLLQGGSCTDQNNAAGQGKSISGFVTGRFGTKHSVTIPAQNMVFLDSTSKLVVNTQLNRIVDGPDYPAMGVPTEDTVNGWFAAWDVSAPMLKNTGIFTYADTQYPKHHPVEDPANWLPLENYPIGLPELAVEKTIFNTRVKSIETINFSETENINTAYIKDCPDTFTASELFSAVILDDRWSKGSQGIVVAVKSNAEGETAIYHNGTNKLSEIMYALSRDKLLKAGESLFDIGLI